MNNAKRIRALEAKRTKLQAKMAAPGADLCALQGQLDAVCYELAEERAIAAEVAP
jgi:hypothetical protein